MHIDDQAMDWGTTLQRRGSKAELDKGGWSVFTSVTPVPELRDPLLASLIRSNGKDAWFGWPTDPKIEAIYTAWLDAQDPAEQTRLERDYQLAAFDFWAVHSDGTLHAAWRLEPSTVRPAEGSRTRVLECQQGVIAGADHASPPSRPNEETAKEGEKSLCPVNRTGRHSSQAVNVDGVAGAGTEGDQRPTLAVGALNHRAFQPAVDGQFVTLGSREVLDGEHSAVRVEHIGVLATATRSVKTAGARRERIRAGICSDGRTA